VLPGTIAIERVLARSEDFAVCAARVAAYPNGFELEVLTMSAEEHVDARESLLVRAHEVPLPGEEIPPEKLRLGARFADATTARNTDPLPQLDARPPGPVMFMRLARIDR